MTIAYKTDDLTAEDTYTDAVKMFDLFNVSITGTWNGTLTLQRSFDGGTTWVDVKTYTQNAQERGLEPEYDVYWRIGFKAGAFTSGSATCRISQ